ncbi:heme-copper oxidase family protein [Halopelagius longus]|uniref:Cbb3-type cytochrome c oxidase subunit I n=1 Tax=Halopelagius longus TaxID=1236180 RepID=A0A1H1FJM4_9EURY|nr:hypothetical protein [Halopelagius longus]RDI70075.1 hypothetical protein DWB78_15720 [Halopelagius longus]SDR01008.1 hypothetical protein SAMN05216278_3243 [Halopelagius longus]
MSAIPCGVDTDSQPPMAIPLRHFLVGLGFLLGGVLVAAADAVGAVSGLVSPARYHLLLAGWVCLTILGAMTQFVPVWSGAEIHSRRLANAQLWCVAVGVAGLAACFLSGRVAWLPAVGAVALVGFWLFVYNVGRTLLTARPLDVTERHFAVALAFFLLVTAFGLALAVDFTRPVVASAGLARANVVAAHATLAAFGAVLTTVFGALYQLATMFTQTELDRYDRAIQRFETVAYPLGVVALAGGRLVAAPSLARAGGVLVLLSLFGVGVVLGRRLVETNLPRSAMLRRYAVVAASLVVWALVTAPSWLADPLAADARFGAAGATPLLAVGVVGFVVLGTLYHVVPFIVWEHRYSDRIGYEPVPTIDDLYDSLVAAADFAATVAGGGLLLAAAWFGLPDAVRLAGGAFVAGGVVLFVYNLASVVHEHGPRGVVGTVLQRSGRRGDDSPPTE